MCFAGFWVPAVYNGQRMAPEGLRATMHTLISVLYSTLGNGIGSFFFGWVYEVYGANVLFMGGGTLMWVVIGLTLWCEISSKKPIQDTQMLDDVEVNFTVGN